MKIYAVASNVAYPTEQRDSLTVYKPENKKDAIFLHPGEPVFERFRSYICGKFAQAALRGGVFIDTNAQQPYIFHLLLISVVRKADPTQRQLALQEILESRLIGLNYFADGRIAQASPEYLTLLKEGAGIPPQASFLVATAQESCQLAKAYALESVAQKLVIERLKAQLI